ncbi:hypothetical protein BGZ59_007072 [Podila verticillata]|nr:hypothetical protein BGZ59_007072 [Podila verticillata]
MHVYSEDVQPVFSMELEWTEDVSGYKTYAISRPELYDLLWRHIPRERIHLGKRVLSFQQDDNDVKIRCSDNQTHHGDILVGSDGAYSAVRQHMYKELRVLNKLPASDDVPRPFSCVCLVGQTVPLDPEEFPGVGLPTSNGVSVLVNTGGNQVCWMVVQYLNKHTSKQNDSFRCSEWGPETAEALCREVRVFKLPGTRNGRPLTLGDDVDKSPKEYISEVMLEEIVFDIWYHGRAVLMGDGKLDILPLSTLLKAAPSSLMNPSGGAGAIMAMHDAVTLANWINTFKLADVKKMEGVWKEYVLSIVLLPWGLLNPVSCSVGLREVTRALMKRTPDWLWKKMGSQIKISSLVLASL